MQCPRIFLNRTVEYVVILIMIYIAVKVTNFDYKILRVDKRYRTLSNPHRRDPQPYTSSVQDKIAPVTIPSHRRRNSRLSRTNQTDDGLTSIDSKLKYANKPHVNESVKAPEPNIEAGKPTFTFMNISALNTSGTYSNPIPKSEYYRAQPKPVNSWTYPVLFNNKDLCKEQNNQKVFLLAVVFTAPSNKKVRDDVRDTWGALMKSSSDVRMSFILGKTFNANDMGDLLAEAKHHQDMIVFDFWDHYEYLAVKSMMSFTWANQFCPNVDFVLKVDDDILLNMHAMIKNLRHHQQNATHHVIGHDVGNRIVYRKTSWRVPIDQYPFGLFPSYMTGPAYIMTSYAVSRVVETSRRVPLVRLEDVYVTGIVRKVAGLVAVHDNAWICGLANVSSTYWGLVRGAHIGVHHLWLDKRRKVHKDIETYHNTSLSKLVS